jgi:hypothetical protein
MRTNNDGRRFDDNLRSVVVADSCETRWRIDASEWSTPPRRTCCTISVSEGMDGVATVLRDEATE